MFVSNISDPITIIENLSSSKDWDYCRINENKINISVKGIWQNYLLEIDYLENTDDLSLLCFFNFKISEKKHLNFFKLMNIINSENINGTFFYFFINIIIHIFSIV